MPRGVLVCQGSLFCLTSLSHLLPHHHPVLPRKETQKRLWNKTLFLPLHSFWGTGEWCDSALSKHHASGRGWICRDVYRNLCMQVSVRLETRVYLQTWPCKGSCCLYVHGQIWKGAYDTLWVHVNWNIYSWTTSISPVLCFSFPGPKLHLLLMLYGYSCKLTSIPGTPSFPGTPSTPGAPSWPCLPTTPRGPGSPRMP